MDLIDWISIMTELNQNMLITSKKKKNMNKKVIFVRLYILHKKERLTRSYNCSELFSQLSFNRTDNTFVIGSNVWCKTRNDFAILIDEEFFKVPQHFRWVVWR